MPRLIAIDLGAYEVKISVFASQGRSWIPDDELRMIVPQDGSAPPTLASRLASLDMLLDANPSLSGSNAFVSVVWPGERASLHRLRLPFTDAGQVEKALPFAIEAEVPFDLDEMVLAWRSSVDGDGTQVLAWMARQRDVRATVDALADRGLNPRHMFVDGDVQGFWAPSTGVTAVIDVGHTHTVVAVVQDGQVQSTRAINVGGRSFTRAIQLALDCSWIDAQRLKHGPEEDAPPAVMPHDAVALADEEDTVELKLSPAGFEEDAEDAESEEATVPRFDPTTRKAMYTPRKTKSSTTLEPETPAPTREELLRAVRPPPTVVELPDRAVSALNGAVGLLLAEIRSTLIQAEDDLGVEIEGVRLTGGGARLAVLWDYLSADLGLPVSHASDPDGQAVDPPFAVSHALAAQMAGWTPGHETDLRVAELAYKGGVDFSKAALLYGGSGLAFFMAAVMVMFVVQYRGLSVELDEVDERIVDNVLEAFPELTSDDVSSGNMAVALLREGLMDAQRQVALLGDASGIPPTVDTLYQLHTSVPPASASVIDITSLQISENLIVMKAETDGFNSVARVEESLKRNPNFTTATKSNESKTSKGKVAFTITVDRGVDDELIGEEG